MTIPLLSLLRDARRARDWGAGEWADTLPRLLQSGMLAHAGALITENGVTSELLPEAVRRQILAAQVTSEAQVRSVRWECGELSRAFAREGIPVILLKGGAYVLGQSRPSWGRFLNDVDILVPKAALADVHRILESGGWRATEDGGVQDEYFREWLHQVPSYHHEVRQTLVDVHHTVIAPWGGHRVAIDRFFASAIPTTLPGILTLPGIDQVLVSAAHIVRTPPGGGGFRSLLDLHELIEDFAGDAAGRDMLRVRSEETGLAGALASATSLAHVLFGTHQFGQRIVGARWRALASIPDGGTVQTPGIRLVRELHRLSTVQAALPFRIMIGRTVRRRVGGLFGGRRGQQPASS